jgi:signal transduction histidine kinase
MNFPAVILAVLYFVTGKIIFAFMGGDTIITLSMFPPEGIALAFAVFYGKRVLPGVFAGQFLLAYFGGMSLFASLCIGLINTAEAWLGIVLFKKMKIDKSFPAFRDYIKFFALVVLILQPFSSITSNIVLLVTNQADGERFLYHVVSWWFGNIMGQIVFTPFLLLMFTERKNLNINKLLLYGFFYGVYIWIIEVVIKVQNPFILIVCSLIVVIFITIRENIVYGWFLSVIAAFTASVTIYLKTGAFANSTLFNNTFNYNFYILLHIVSVVIIGVLFEERKNFENFLQKRIKEETEKNKEKMLLLMQQNRHAQMGELISMIAHQWRQPLNNLAMLNQILIMKLETGEYNGKDVEYFKSNSKKQIEYMSKTIDDFRNFFKDEKERKTFYVGEIVKSAVDMVKPVFEKECINIAVKEQHKNIMCFGYANNLMQTVVNILNNARDALIEKNITEKMIEIRIFQDKNTVTIAIEDNAGGIDSGIIEKIFEPYFSTKSKNGSGLGLYMSKEIIENQLGGKLEVKNSEKGAEFMIVLKRNENV